MEKFSSLPSHNKPPSYNINFEHVSSYEDGGFPYTLNKLIKQDKSLYNILSGMDKIKKEIISDALTKVGLSWTSFLRIRDNKDAYEAFEDLIDEWDEKAGDGKPKSKEQHEVEAKRFAELLDSRG